MPALSLNSRKQLIESARESLENFVRKSSRGEIPRNLTALREFPPELQAPRSCFVTVRKGEKLRGCVGEFSESRPLLEEVAMMTVKAATEDPRFPPVRIEELDEIRIEISVLSPLERVYSPDEIEIGRHGILVRWSGRSGVFLPEVATEMGWGGEELIRACMRHKAFLPDEVRPELEIFRFTTEKIKEER